MANARSELPDRNLALELVRTTEAAALAAARWMGRGDKEGADGAAVDAMRIILGSVPMDGVVVIGEGEKDEEIEVDKYCKFHTHGYQCYNLLKWNYCKFVHSDEVRRAYQLAQQQSITASQLLEELESNPDCSEFLKKSLRYVCDPP